MNAGKCNSCNYQGPLQEFVNDLADPEVRFNLCPRCFRKAYLSIQIFIQTPSGRAALMKKMQKGVIHAEDR